MVRRLTLAFAAAALVFAALPAPAQEPARALLLPLAITVAQHESAPVVSESWIESQVNNANALFEPHGVSFRVVHRERMDERYARLETRRDRHALGALVRPGVISCFLVLSLRDVDEPSRYRQGVHWRARGAGAPPGARLVIVSSIAGPYVLAHELGHYFGNRHSDVPGNIMSYERGEGPPFFDEAQARRIRTSARRALRRGELRTTRN